MIDINFLPETLQEKQKEARLRLLANSGSVILLVLILMVMVVVFSYRSHLTRTLTTIIKEQGQVENEIAQFREEEGLYRFLGLKLASLVQSLETREVYGAKIARLREVFANSANLSKISTGEGQEVLLFGEAPSFPDLAVRFTDLGKTEVFESFEITFLGVNQEKGVVEFGIEGTLKK